MTDKELRIKVLQKEAIQTALKETDGNRTEAAVLLGVSVRTIRNWIKKYNLSKKFPHQRGR